MSQIIDFLFFSESNCQIVFSFKLCDVTTLKSLLKPIAEIEIIFGYDSELEPTQTSRLQLNEIDENKIIHKFEAEGFKLAQSSMLSSTEIKKLESTWGKRIGTTSERKIFNLVFRI